MEFQIRANAATSSRQHNRAARGGYETKAMFENSSSNDPVNLNSHIKGKEKIQVEAAII